MSNYLNVLALIAPVFLLLAIGMGLRWKGILQPEAEKGIVNLVVKALYPCLIVKSMLEADSFRRQPDVLLAPVAGFATIVCGFLLAKLAARAIGMQTGKGLRTFAFSVGIFNYGYLPIPLVESLYGPNELAVLFMHNVGIEFAIWTIGVALLAGGSAKDGIKKIFNPMVVALVIGATVNFSGFASDLPDIVMTTLRLLGGCAIPLGLLAIGANLYEYLDTKEPLWNTRDVLGGIVLRLGLLPLIGIAIAWFAPLSIELKRILVIQAAMPAGIMPIVLAKHYGGQPIVAVRIVFATTIVGFATMPLWIHFGSLVLER
ncbi:AEC family transporter [Pelagicoccus sp. SDUM812003]|uniref:AEC family transporter n=1 Tax=Pelagicoccus sp. SDUM812003 TaxID=3041267 RepID=UPI002810983B|nr:AEC family transporter [Pelagicoccus sp. SDUM812003]MDQ8204593.1 AEC family transporter [Pelagicoccus sp. SDUM812003]